MKWLELIGREDLIDKPGKNYCVCEEHFKVQDILTGLKRNSLKKTALPSLRLPRKSPNIFEDIVLETGTTIKIEELDTDDSQSSIAEYQLETTRKRKLSTPTAGPSIAVPDTQASNLVFLGQDTFQRLCNKFLTKELSDIVKAEATLKELIVKKNINLNLLRLHLYHSGPQAYRMLRGALHLPCPSTLHKNVLPITTEINNENFISLLASKVNNMTDMEKNCSAIIASVSLKPNLFYNIKHDIIIGFHDINGIRLSEIADQAYVMMLRGIYSNWKQPVGYTLLSSGDNAVEFNEWIDGLLEQLIKIGFNVRTLVSDTGKAFIEAAKNRAVSVENPYFLINDKRIYYIFDAPHLIKLACNFFRQHDFRFHDCQAKYEHVRSFYDKDKNKKFKLAPKLTKNHIHPTNLQKMELRYAIQIFSNSVATGISTYVDFYVIDQSAINTADFIKLMNNLFDSMNSSDPKESDEHKAVYRGTESQLIFLNDMLQLFRSLKLSDERVDCKFIQGFQITITSILQLFEHLQAEGYTYLPTRSLNSEYIEKFLTQVRKKSGIVSAPTSWQVVSTYRNSLLCNCIKPLERKTSAEDLSKWVMQIQSNKFKKVLNKDALESDEEVQNNFKILSSDYNKQEFDTKHCLFEVSHFLLAKCAEKHECRFFKSYTRPYKNIPDFIEENRYQGYKEYSKDKCKSLLVIPCDNFVQFVKKIDARFVPCFRMANARKNIREILYNSIIDEPYVNPPCACFPKVFLVKLFVRMKMYNVIKFNNKAFGVTRAGKLVVNRF